MRKSGASRRGRRGETRNAPGRLRTSAGSAVTRVASGLTCVLLSAGLATPASARWFWEREPASDAQTTAGGKADRGDARHRSAVNLTIDITGGNGDVRSAVQDASGLYGLEQDGAHSTDEVLRAALSERARIIGAMYQQGRYAAIVEVEVAGTSVSNPAIRDAIDAAFARGTVPATIRLTPGPVFHLGTVAVHDPDGRPATIVGAAATGLAVGDVAGSAGLVAAEARLTSAMQNDGYPLARVTSREVVADHRAVKVDVTYVVDPGRSATFGAVEVRGTDKMNPGLIRRWAPFKAGERYDPAQVTAYERYLRGLEVFDSVRVTTAQAVEADGSIPIIVTVAERKLHYVGASATWSSTDGAALTAYWGHRNLFGGAERLRLDATVSRLFVNATNDLEYRVGFTFTKPGIWSYKNDLTIASHLVREAPKAYTREGFDNTISLIHRFDDRRDVSIGFSPSWSHITDAYGDHYYALFGMPVAGRIDTTDDKLNPSEGYRAVGSIEPVVGDIGDSNFMLLSNATFSAYKALDDAKRFIVAGRVQIGSVVGPSLADTPANDRLYAGGGGSIRGYAYQAASPRDAWGQITGGRSLFVTSLELRTRITETIGLVPFVDMGSAYTESWPNFSEPLKIGVGLGLRYFTSIGPLRLDVAVPTTHEKGDPSVAAYLSIGQAF